MDEGQSLTLGSVEISAVYADHGELAPDALGMVLNFGGIKVYHTGDTAYRPDEFAPAIKMRPDVLIPCINGAFGNMDAEEWAKLTSHGESASRDPQPLLDVRRAKRAAGGFSRPVQGARAKDSDCADEAG